jgi:hypothetical protein
VASVTRDIQAKVWEEMEYCINISAVWLMRLISSACGALRKLSEILYQSVYAPSTINANFNFYEFFKVFTSLPCIVLPHCLGHTSGLPPHFSPKRFLEDGCLLGCCAM